MVGCSPCFAAAVPRGSALPRRPRVPSAVGGRGFRAQDPDMSEENCKNLDMAENAPDISDRRHCVDDDAFGGCSLELKHSCPHPYGFSGQCRMDPAACPVSDLASLPRRVGGVGQHQHQHRASENHRPLPHHARWVAADGGCAGRSGYRASVRQVRRLVRQASDDRHRAVRGEPGRDPRSDRVRLLGVALRPGSLRRAHQSVVPELLADPGCLSAQARAFRCERLRDRPGAAVDRCAVPDRLPAGSLGVPLAVCVQPRVAGRDGDDHAADHLRVERAPSRAYRRARRAAAGRMVSR